MILLLFKCMNKLLLLILLITRLYTPQQQENNMYCLVEVSGSNQEHNDEKLSEFLEVVMEKGLITDGTIAQDLSKARVRPRPHLSHAPTPFLSYVYTW